MIARARRAFSGVMVSVLLAAPAVAAVPSSAHATSVGSRHHAHSRKSVVMAHARRGVWHGAAAAHRTRVADMPVGESFAMSPARTKQVDVAETAFVNDGGAWLRPGTDAPVQTAIMHGPSPRFSQVGVASWYGGSQWQGHETSSGERFDQNQLTAAHATLPLGSVVRVTMADGSASVVVRITDRPGTRKRIIDLSRAAAARLGILDRGIAMVKVDGES